MRLVAISTLLLSLAATLAALDIVQESAGELCCKKEAKFNIVSETRKVVFIEVVDQKLQPVIPASIRQTSDSFIVTPKEGVEKLIVRVSTETETLVTKEFRVSCND